MTTSLVSGWFGQQFSALHPLLQQLHREGGHLSGTVELGMGSGPAGWLGRRLARGMGLPGTPGRVPMTVDISHTASELVWARGFGEGGASAVSRFQPRGRWPEGDWLERSGPLRLRLTVDVVDGGWQWRALGVRWHGVPLPVALLPRSHAGKRVEDGAYLFSVAFTAPLLGPLLWYRGVLRPLAPPASPAGNPPP